MSKGRACLFHLVCHTWLSRRVCVFWFTLQKGPVACFWLVACRDERPHSCICVGSLIYSSDCWVIHCYPLGSRTNDLILYLVGGRAVHFFTGGRQRNVVV